MARLYVLDWYDRYHCYQDANADPLGVDRGRGRSYRVVHGDRPSAKVKDFSRLESAELVTLLGDSNIFNRRQSQLELCERQAATKEPKIAEQLFAISLDAKRSSKNRMHALWSMIGSGMVSDGQLMSWLACEDALIRSWGVRTAGRQQNKSTPIVDKVKQLAGDQDSTVRLQVAIAIPKLDTAESTKTFVEILRRSEEDPILSRVVWQNLLPRLKPDQKAIEAELVSKTIESNELLCSVAPRIASYWMSELSPTLESADDQARIATVLRIAENLFTSHPMNATQVLRVIVAKAEAGGFRGPAIQKLLSQWLQPTSNSTRDTRFVASIAQSPKDSSEWGETIEQLKTLSGDTDAIQRTQSQVLSAKTPFKTRVALLRAASVSSTETLSKGAQSVARSSRKWKANRSSLCRSRIGIGHWQRRFHRLRKAFEGDIEVRQGCASDVGGTLLPTAQHGRNVARRDRQRTTAKGYRQS